MELYLDTISNNPHRIALLRLGRSSHTLEIQQGRQTVPPHKKKKIVIVCD